jgi:hypothetical protein
MKGRSEKKKLLEFTPTTNDIKVSPNSVPGTGLRQAVRHPRQDEIRVASELVHHACTPLSKGKSESNQLYLKLTPGHIQCFACSPYRFDSYASGFDHPNWSHFTAVYMLKHNQFWNSTQLCLDLVVDEDSRTPMRYIREPDQEVLIFMCIDFALVSWS